MTSQVKNIFIFTISLVR